MTIGQSPRPDVVPDMAAVIGPGAEIREGGALDGLSRAEIDALAPQGDDEILVSRLRDGAPVFLGRQRIEGLLEARIAALEREGATVALRRAAEGVRGSGLVVMDCMGFRRKTRDEMAGLTGAPILLANLLVARVVAELCGAG